MPRWPYICGQAARSADNITGGRTLNPLVAGPGYSGGAECWDAGYKGLPEPVSVSKVNDDGAAIRTTDGSSDRKDHSRIRSDDVDPERQETSDRHGVAADDADAGRDPAGRHEASVPKMGMVDRIGASCGIVVCVDFLNLLVRSFHASPVSLVNGVRGMLDTVASVIDRLNPEYIVFALDGGHVERSQLYPDYKAHRGPKPPELASQIELAERVLVAIGWPSIRVTGWEADDVLASLATKFDEVAAGVIVVSSDKDLQQLLATTGCQIYQPWNGGTYINRKTCQDKFGCRVGQLGDYLALVGDASDGVPGVKGIGPKKATELLAAHQNLDEILEAARCLKIPGAAGKQLREQADQARLSRKLVTLKADLPVGRDWGAWPLSEPRLGWQQRLTAMGLGAAAQRLAQRLPGGIPDFGRHRSSAIQVEWIKVDLPNPADFMTPVPVDPKSSIPSPVSGGLNPEREVATSPAAAIVAPDDARSTIASSDEPAAQSEPTSEHGTWPSTSASTVGTASSDSTISLGQRESTIESNRQSARKVYDQAVAARLHYGKPAASGYYPGTLLRLAWDAGSDGRPFDELDFAPFDHFGKPIRSSRPSSLFSTEA